MTTLINFPEKSLKSELGDILGNVALEKIYDLVRSRNLYLTIFHNSYSGYLVEISGKDCFKIEHELELLLDSYGIMHTSYEENYIKIEVEYDEHKRVILFLLTEEDNGNP